MALSEHKRRREVGDLAVDCDQVRAALSARLDGESTDLPDDVIDAHLEACEDCQRWYTTVTALGRSLRIGPLGDETDSATVAPDAAQVTNRVLAVAETMPVVTSGLSKRQLPLTIARVALLLLALVYFSWAGMLLFATPLTADSSIGDANEPLVNRLIMDAAVGKFALAVGLGCAAARPKISAAVLPIYLAQWAFGAGFATREVVMGFVESSTAHGLLANPLWALAVHLCGVIALLVCWIGRNHMFTPLRQSWRALSARPVNFSPVDLDENSSFRLGDRKSPDFLGAERREER